MKPGDYCYVITASHVYSVEEWRDRCRSSLESSQHRRRMRKLRNWSLAVFGTALVALPVAVALILVVAFVLR